MSEILNKPMIDAMITKFLSWKLPDDFSPDCGIKFAAPVNDWPVGTNLFTGQQARAMIEHMLSDCMVIHMTEDQADAALAHGHYLEQRLAEAEATTQSAIDYRADELANAAIRGNEAYADLQAKLSEAEARIVELEGAVVYNCGQRKD